MKKKLIMFFSSTILAVLPLLTVFTSVQAVVTFEPVTYETNARYPDWGDEDTTGPLDITNNGNIIVFSSVASNLVSNDTNNVADCFVFTRSTNQMERKSVSSGGGQANAASGGCKISEMAGLFGNPKDRIVFHSDATNLVPNDINGKRDVFLRTQNDFDLGTNTFIISKYDDPQFPYAYGNAVSEYPDLSSDGLSIFYHTAANNLGPVDTNGKIDIYESTINYLGQGQIDVDHNVVSRSTDGTESNGESKFVSAAKNFGSYPYPQDRRIAYQTKASNLDGSGGSPYPTHQIMYTYIDEGYTNPDVLTHYLVSEDSTGNIGNGYNIYPNFCYLANGIAFVSSSTNFDVNDTNNEDDIYVNLWSDPVRASVGPQGASSNDQSMYPYMSPECDYVAYRSHADNLVQNDNNQVSDVFRIKLISGQPNYGGPIRLSVQADGDEVDDASAYVALGDDADVAAIMTKANDLVEGWGLPSNPPYPDPWQVVARVDQ